MTPLEKRTSPSTQSVKTPWSGGSLAAALLRIWRGTEGGKEGGREGGREGRRKGVREGGSEGGNEGEREGVRKGSGKRDVYS